ncbi:MAG: DUF5916 domain-containing protein [Gemmatimonadaceae bacterium]
MSDPARVRRKSGVRCLVLAGLAAVGAMRASPVSAQSLPFIASDTIPARRLTASEASAMRVDGLLSEAVWRDVAPISGFRQKEPIEGVLATEQTEIRIVYDGGTMYVGVTAHDDNPRGVIARILARDKVMVADFDGKPKFAGDDAIAILFDPFHDHRNAFVFATNPNGAEFDGLLTDEGREFNVDWRGIWSVSSKRTADGWSAEFAIPFRTLRYPSNPSTWGFNAYRVIRRKNEETLWRSYSRSNEGFARVSRAGHLTGLADLPSPGLNADLRPYLVGGGDEVHAVDSATARSTTGGVGLDFKSEVRPGLVLDLTYNTDFAQVEVDDQQVNLTRFDLFFPEKREFFLENSGIFEFGARGNFEPPPFQLFFSRQVGISDSGAIPVLGGGRLTGRVGQQTLGLLSVMTGEKYGEPRTAFNVGRIKRDIGGANYVGAMIVDRRSDSTWNTAGGLDWSFWPASAFNVQGFVAKTSTKGEGGDGAAYRVAADYQTSRFGLTSQHVYVGPDATADAGFVTRTNIRRTQANLRYTLRPQQFNLRRINLLLWNDVVADTGWRRQDYSVSFGFRPIFNTDDGLGIFYTVGRNRITESFDLADTVRVDVGDYLYRTVSIFAQSATSRLLSVDVNADLQDEFGGRVTRLSGNLSAAPSIHLGLKGGYTFSRASLPNGDFDVHLVSLRAAYAFTTRLSLNSLLQYNSLTRDLSVNARLNFIYRPGSDIFVVLNEERGGDLSTWGVKSRGLRLKLTYLARL